MGATVTTGKMAGAFRSKSNDVVYLLFEQTYEKNVTPHTPRWSCVFVGTITGAVERIFACASSCEGGSLQNRNGCITPEGYIAGWLKELSNPAEMPDTQITLYSAEGFYAPIPSGSLAKAQEVLASIGRQDLADELASHKLKISLHSDSDVVLALYSGENDWSLSPWRIFDSVPSNYPRNRSLGYNPVPTKKFDLPNPSVLHVDNENRLLQRPDGSWYCAGWEYSVIGSYIEGFAKTELAEPGTYCKRIKAYRAAIKSGPKMPSGGRVIINTSVPTESYLSGRITELAKQASTILPDGFIVDIPAGDIYHLTGLPLNVATWVFDVPQLDEQLQMVYI